MKCWGWFWADFAHNRTNIIKNQCPDFAKMLYLFHLQHNLRKCNRDGCTFYLNTRRSGFCRNSVFCLSINNFWFFQKLYLIRRPKAQSFFPKLGILQQIFPDSGYFLCGSTLTKKFRFWNFCQFLGYST